MEIREWGREREREGERKREEFSLESQIHRPTLNYIYLTYQLQQGLVTHPFLYKNINDKNNNDNNSNNNNDNIQSMHALHKANFLGGYVALSRPTVKCEKTGSVFVLFCFVLLLLLKMSDLGEEFAKICIQWLKKALVYAF